MITQNTCCCIDLSSIYDLIYRVAVFNIFKGIPFQNINQRSKRLSYQRRDQRSMLINAKLRKEKSYPQVFVGTQARLK